MKNADELLGDEFFDRKDKIFGEEEEMKYFMDCWGMVENFVRRGGGDGRRMVRRRRRRGGGARPHMARIVCLFGVVLTLS